MDSRADPPSTGEKMRVEKGGNEIGNLGWKNTPKVARGTGGTRVDGKGTPRGGSV